MAKAKSKPDKQVKVKEITLEVVGLEYRLTKPTLRKLAAYRPLPAVVEREPDNVHDEDALKVSVHDDAKEFGGMQIGYLRRQVSAEWSPQIDAGRVVIVSAEIVAVYPELNTAEVKIGFTKRKIAT